MPLSDAERSRRFWRSTATGYCGGEYQSLADITRGVHLIVTGTIVDAKADSFVPFEGGGGSIAIATGIVHVDEVLQGAPRMHEETIDVAELAWPGITVEELPTEPLMLFLMNEAQQRAEGGYSQGDPGAEFRYWRPNYLQAVLRNVNGEVRVPNPDDPSEHPCTGEYPLDLNGANFEDVAERVRDIVSATTSASSFPPDPASYVSDELLVTFCDDPSSSALQRFEDGHELVLDHDPVRPGPAPYLFRILDGVDAVDKLPAVTADDLVCRVNLNWLGVFY